MKVKSLKRLALLMSMVTLFSTACGQVSEESNKNDQVSQQNSTVEASNSEVTVPVESGYPEYLNLDGPYPLLKEGYEDEVTLKVLFCVESASVDWDNLWIKKYLEDKYNIKLEMELITPTERAEKKSLLLNSGELPDLMWNMTFTTEELVKYGQEEGLLLACDEYMNETLTPSILSYMTDAVKTAITAGDGHVYSLPFLVDGVESNPGYLPRMFMNKAWLETLSLEMPWTLDEFVDALYAIKEADPAGVGSENVYPFGGGMETESGVWYLLNAFGYNVTSQWDWYGMNPTLRDGEVVLPYYDMDVYKEFLALMNQFYNDGIINSNFFTIETTEVNSQMLNGQTATYAQAAFVSGIDTWKDWEACYPLTSNWQTEPEIANSNTVTIGGFVVSADTEHPELCMRLADLFYNNTTDTSMAFWGTLGPNSEYAYEGWVYPQIIENADGTSGLAYRAEDLPEGVDILTYYMEYLSGSAMTFGTYTTTDAAIKWATDAGCVLGDASKVTYDVNDPNGNFMASLASNVAPYVAEGYPFNLWVNAETAQKIADLETVIESYAKEQIARFITGARPLSETDDFVKELEGMGVEELLQIYKDNYTK